MIYGIGLPRTGTSTLAECLRLLRLQGFSYCGLSKVERQDEKNEFMVDNTVSTIIPLLYKVKPNSKFILTTRENKCWAKSVLKYSDSIEGMYPTEYEEYVKTIIPEEQLLVVDWNKKANWQALCKFLELPVPPYAFPCENC